MNIKKSNLILTIFLFLLVISSTFALTIPCVYAAEITDQEKGLSVLNNVIGLDTPKYIVTTKSYEQQTTYLGVIPQENIIYNLTSSQSSVKALYTFANGNLQVIQVLENKGSPRLTKPINAAPLELAKDFLSNYQTYTNNPLYGQLKATLADVDDSKNMTKNSGNTQLEVNAIDGYTTFKWTYTFNGIIAPPKFVALGFNNSFLTAFVDNWQLYEIGNTNTIISQNDAINIALDSAKVHFSDDKTGNSTFNLCNLNESNVRWTALLFDNSLNATKARSKDVLELYPVYRVGIALDKWYGQLYGVEVNIWADTKEVRNIQDAYSTLPSEEEFFAESATSNQISNTDPSEATTSGSNMMWIGISIITLAIITTSLVWIRKERISTSGRLLKLRSVKVSGVLVCLLMIFLVMSESIASTSANSGAIVFGSESTGSYDATFSPNYNWRKSLTEIGLQQSVANTIANTFGNNGYVGYNYQGGGSVKNTYLLSTLSYLSSTYTNIAVVDFDHGMGRHDYSQAPNEFHFLFEDEVGTAIGPRSGWYYNPSNGVYDMDIYPRVSNGQVTFALINACGSANLTNLETGAAWQGPGTYGARGMPYAWTHRIVKYLYDGTFNVANDISSYGYQYPDTGSQVYMGFYFGSASLEQQIPYNSGPQYYHWVTDFFSYALNYDISVNEALDHASWVQWGVYFGNSPLWTGFTASWWNMSPFYNSRIAVYGNGNIHL